MTRVLPLPMIGRKLKVTLLAVSAAGAFAPTVFIQPASAQLAVFDPNNYAQNLLSAARSLQQINNQIQSLQNEATMLTSMAKNLKRIEFAEFARLERALSEIETLMDRAEGIRSDTDAAGAEFLELFPDGLSHGDTASRVSAGQARLGMARSALQHTLGVQTRIVANLREDATALSAIVARSQGAEGALQVGQATNQLLALTAKQQIQIQNMMAAQYRADAIDRARRMQAEAEARASTTRFLGSGKAYTPQ